MGGGPEQAPSGTDESQKYETEDYALLYNTSIQKFLTYSIIGAATFVGYVQLSIELHISGLSPIDHYELLFVIAALFVAVLFAAVAAARQYFFAAACHGSDRLRLRGFEDRLVQGAPAIFRLLNGASHGFDYSSDKPNRANYLIGVIGLVCVVLILVLAFAIS